MLETLAIRVVDLDLEIHCSFSDYYGPQAQIDPNFVTSSGFSSGAFMNMQLHFCYSHVIKAVGMFAGG